MFVQLRCEIFWPNDKSLDVWMSRTNLPAGSVVRLIC